MRIELDLDRDELNALEGLLVAATNPDFLRGANLGESLAPALKAMKALSAARKSAATNNQGS